MPNTSETLKLFTENHGIDERFVNAVGYPLGIRAFFKSSSLLKPGLRVLDAGCGTGVITLALHDAITQRGYDPGHFTPSISRLRCSVAFAARSSDADDREGSDDAGQCS